MFHLDCRSSLGCGGRGVGAGNHMKKPQGGSLAAAYHLSMWKLPVVTMFLIPSHLDFTGGSVDANLAASAGDKGSIPDLGRSHMPKSN